MASDIVYAEPPSTFPRSYLVPRRGEIEPAQVVDRDQLRQLRTELELLRRIRRRASSSVTVADRLSEAKYSAEDRRELVQILLDARHPIVEETVDLVDQEFGDLRREIVMSVVNEQAENIVQEAAESGALGSIGSHGPTEPSGSAPPSIDEALAAAEAELASIAALQKPPEHAVAAPAPPRADDGDALPMESDPGAEPPAESTLAAAAPDHADPPVDHQADAVGPDAPATPDLSPIGAVDRPTTFTSNDDTTHASQSVVRSDPVYTAHKAEQVVAQIEVGIRKLASILSDEVNDQWKRAGAAFQDVLATRTRTEETYREAAALLKEVVRAKEEAEVARDDAEVARREAKLLRDDARRAKERAEASAAAL